jgi:uncharacterized protein YndB with AHSA1/START domain
MAGRFEASVPINPPIEEVFAFLADGENDPKFNPRVLEIAKTTEGPPGVGTVYASTVKDAGVKTKREFKLTEFEPPTRIRWAEVSQNLVMAPEGGYDLAEEDGATRLTVTTSSRGTAWTPTQCSRTWLMETWDPTPSRPEPTPAAHERPGVVAIGVSAGRSTGCGCVHPKSSASSSIESTPASAFDTGQPSLAAWACCWNSSASMPGTRARERRRM